MATVAASGTQATSINTEHTLTTQTVAGTYVLTIDTNAMVNGDLLEIRIYQRALTGGINRLHYFAAFQHAQATPIKSSIPVVSQFNAHVTIRQTAGTGRSFPWRLESI